MSQLSKSSSRGPNRRLFLKQANPAEWDGVLNRYTAEYGITVLLYRNIGEQLAGPRTRLPAEVYNRLPRGGPPPPPRRGSPAARREPPPDFGPRGPREPGDRRGPPPDGGPGPREFGDRGRGGASLSVGPTGPPTLGTPPASLTGQGPVPPRPQNLAPGAPFLVVTQSQPQYWVGVRMPFIDMPDGEALRSVLILTSSTFFTNPFFFEIKPLVAMPPPQP